MDAPNFWVPGTQPPFASQLEQQASPEFEQGMQPASGVQISLLVVRISSPIVRCSEYIQQSGPPQQIPPQLQNPSEQHVAENFAQS